MESRRFKIPYSARVAHLALAAAYRDRVEYLSEMTPMEAEQKAA